MMDKAGNHTGRIRALAIRMLRNALAGTVLTLAFTACAHRQASAEIEPNIYYEYHQSDRFGLSYSITREAMKDVYAPSLANGAPPTNPLIGIGEVDLNGDKSPEIIGYPTEEYEEEGQFCTQKGMCPHYILQVREKELHRLGIIYADAVMLGDNVTNGYWELRVYKNGNEDKSRAEIYVYDKNKDGYVPKTP
jgi:hypothetical protein